jgi:ribosomal protein S18 acetylase RimI-like enzyme
VELGRYLLSRREDELHEIRLRRAKPDDVTAIATLFRSTRRKVLAFLPVVHTPAEDVAYFSETVFTNSELWVVTDANARVEQKVLGFCAFHDGWVDHLYVHPDYARNGIGKQLLQKAQETQPQLQLWVFQKNSAAIAFYEAMGFRLLRQTDGRDNEEKEPDALYEWNG